MARTSMFKNYRVYILTSVAYMGSLLFGYDTGVMGSVLALTSFKEDFGLPTSKTGFADEKNANISSNVVSLLTAGGFFGSIAAAWANERFGRRYSLMFFSLILLIGAAIQTAATHSIGQIYAGRVIAGLGIGGMTSITPVFVSENAPAEVRGRIAGLFQEFLVFGTTFAYWLDYGVSLRIKPSTKQWRVPVAIQLIPGGLMLIGLFFLKESPRWLMKQGRHDEALDSLAYIRNTERTDPEVLHELAEVRAAVDEEIHLTEGITCKTFLLHRLSMHILTCLLLQGKNVFNQVFEFDSSLLSLLCSANNSQVLLRRPKQKNTPARESVLYCHCLMLVLTVDYNRYKQYWLLCPRNLRDYRCLFDQLCPFRYRCLWFCQNRCYRDILACWD